MKKQKIKFGFEILTEAGPLPKPVSLKITESKEVKEFNKPLKYMADALVGLSMIRLNPNFQCPVSNKDREHSICLQAWNHLDAHHAIFNRSQDRVEALRSNVESLSPTIIAGFEKSFLASLEQACKIDEINLKDLWPLLDAITYLESKTSTPLLFNFGLQFSKTFVEKCHSLYSMLFNLRSIMAVDYNSHVEDASHEGLKVDSITDYLPKAEYIVNDALLYYHFRKLSMPFIAGRNSDVRIEKLLVEPMKKHFENFAHDAVYLIDNLPTEFTDSFRTADLEEALYLVQMDWLLGSEAGLLFRLREELYGLLNGYEKIFWHERDGRRSTKPVHLSLHFELSEEDWASSKVA